MSSATLKDPGALANFVGLCANVILMITKFVIGWIAASAALTADGFNSAGDIFATTIAFGAYVYAKRPPDAEHNYGHGNAESVAGVVIGAMLLATGIFIFIQGLMPLLGGKSEPPGLLAAYAAVFTVIVKELLYRYAVRVGRRLNSPTLLASARDHRADVFVGLTVLAGVFGARFAVPWLDPLAAVLVGLYIAWMAFEPLMHNVNVLMDRAPDGMADRIHDLILERDDVFSVDEIRVHPVGSYYNVDFKICVDGEHSLREADRIAHLVEDEVKQGIDHVRSVAVHVNPALPGGCCRLRESCETPCPEKS